MESDEFEGESGSFRDEIGKVIDWTEIDFLRNQFTNQKAFEEEDMFLEHFDKNDTGRFTESIYKSALSYLGYTFSELEAANNAKQSGYALLNNLYSAPSVYKQQNNQNDYNKNRNRNLNNANKSRGRYPNSSSMANKPSLTPLQYKWFINPSIIVRDNWTEVIKFDFAKLARLNGNNLPRVTDLLYAGMLPLYDKRTEVLAAQESSLMLTAAPVTQYSVPASEDPLIRQFLNKGIEVFSTDSVISSLMAATRSNASWHISIVKVDGVIFLDETSSCPLELNTVYESAKDPPFKTKLDNPIELSIESTTTQQRLISQCTSSEKRHLKEFDVSVPFAGAPHTQNTSGYRYRLFEAADDIKILIRCRHDAYMNDKMINIYSLLEWNSRDTGSVDWKQNYHSHSASILAHEAKANRNQTAKWVARSYLSGADEVKIGFVSRVNFGSDNQNHKVVGIFSSNTESLSKLIDLNFFNAWDVVIHIVSAIRQLPDGSYVLMKVPMKNELKVFEVVESELPSENEDILTENLINPDIEIMNDEAEIVLKTDIDLIDEQADDY